MSDRSEIGFDDYGILHESMKLWWVSTYDDLLKIFHAQWSFTGQDLSERLFEDLQQETCTSGRDHDQYQNLEDELPREKLLSFDDTMRRIIGEDPAWDYHSTIFYDAIDKALDTLELSDLSERWKCFEQMLENLRFFLDSLIVLPLDDYSMSHILEYFVDVLSVELYNGAIDVLNFLQYDVEWMFSRSSEHRIKKAYDFSYRFSDCYEELMMLYTSSEWDSEAEEEILLLEWAIDNMSKQEHESNILDQGLSECVKYFCHYLLTMRFDETLSLDEKRQYRHLAKNILKRSWYVREVRQQIYEGLQDDEDWHDDETRDDDL